MGLEELDLAKVSGDTIQALRLRSQESLFFFAKGVLGLSKLNPRIHGPICRLLESPSTRKRLKITLPRGWYKTSLVSIAYPMWRACLDSNIRVVLIQNTHTNALSKLGVISRHFETNQLLRALFPEVLPDKNCTWVKDKLELKRETPSDVATFEAAGISTQTVSRHYDIVIEDDTVAPDTSDMGEENIAPTKEQIEQAIGFHKYMVPPLFVDIKDGENIVVGTRWFEHDLLSHIEQKEPSFTSYTRAVRENDVGQSDESGDITFPEQFPAHELDTLRERMGPYMFSCLYLNKPIRTGDMIFHPEWFHYYEEPPRDFVTYTSVDPAGDPEDTKGEPDYNVVATCGKDLITGRIFLLDYYRAKCSVSELVDAFFRQTDAWKPLRCAIETVAYQKTLLYILREQMKARSKHVNIEGITWGRKSKNARIMGLQPLLSAGKLLIRKHHQEFVREALAFPLGKHDDLIDCVSMQLGLWALTKSKTELAKDTYDDPFSVDQAIQDIRSAAKSKIPNYLDCLRSRRRPGATTSRVAPFVRV